VSTPGGGLAIPVSADDHALGPQSASITLVEYGDYECSYCGAAYPIVAALQRTFGDELRFVFRNMPLTNVHPHAEAAAEAAEAVGLQGHFWEMHDLLFEHQNALDPSALLSYASASGADSTEFEVALERRVTRERVQHDVEGGLRSGVNGTPTFFVNEARYDGSWELAPFERYLASLVERRHADGL
jgi:protein-disulfide isomerase